MSRAIPFAGEALAAGIKATAEASKFIKRAAYRQGWDYSADKI
jgi:hypothetical protein